MRESLALPPTTDTHPTLELAPGAELAGCRIEEVAGRGGMGVVYRATQLDLGRPVAIKVIAADRARDPGLRTRFSLEARLAAAIDHPNLVPVHAAGEEDGRLYLVMRYVAGTDLHRALKRDGHLSPGRAAKVVSQVAAGLDAAHAAGLVHRDVKPANVLLSSEHVYLGDFGLSRLQGAGERITESGAWIGTVDYMSPEHLRGEPCDARSDVYALGCVLFAALTGEPPFRRDTVPQTMSAHLHQPPPLPSERAPVPAELRPRDRPRAGQAPRGPLPVGRRPRPRRARRRRGRAGHRAGAHRRHRRRRARPASRRRCRPSCSRAPRAAPRRRQDPWEPPVHAPALKRRRTWVPRRGVLGLLAVAALSAAVAAAMIVRDGSGASGGSPQLSTGEVRDAADAFAGAIASEDAGALSRVLARDVKRVFPGDSQRGRAAVLATYRGQFKGNEITGYELSDLDVSGGRDGRAAGTYELRRGGRDATGGRIVLGVKRERGRARSP